MPGHIDVKSDQAELRTLIERVRRGEELELAENGRVFARLVPVAPATPEQDQAERERIAALRRSAFGMYGDRVWIAEDAFEPDEELIESFYADDPLSREPEPPRRA